MNICIFLAFLKLYIDLHLSISKKKKMNKIVRQFFKL